MKLVSYALLVASSLVAATCFGAATMGPDCTSLETLTVGTQFGIPPYETINTAGAPVGFDVDIACELRKRVGFDKIQFKMINPLDPTNLNTGNVTITISALNEINNTLLAQEAVVKYSDFGFGLLFSGPIPPAFSNPATVLGALAAADVPVGIINNSFEGPILVAVGVEGDDIIPFASVADATAALKSGAITAFFSNNVVVNTANSGNSSLTPLNNVILPAGTALDPFRATGLGIGVSSMGTMTDDTACCQLYVNIREAIAEMVADGTYAALAKKNGVPETFTAADFTPAACASTTPHLPQRNNISTFIFNKYCVCMPTIVPATVTPAMATTATVTPAA